MTRRNPAVIAILVGVLLALTPPLVAQSSCVGSVCIGMPMLVGNQIKATVNNFGGTAQTYNACYVRADRGSLIGGPGQTRQTQDLGSVTIPAGGSIQLCGDPSEAGDWCNGFRLKDIMGNIVAQRAYSLITIPPLPSTTANVRIRVGSGLPAGTTINITIDLTNAPPGTTVNVTIDGTPASSVQAPPAGQTIDIDIRINVPGAPASGSVKLDFTAMGQMMPFSQFTFDVGQIGSAVKATQNFDGTAIGTSSCQTSLNHPTGLPYQQWFNDVTLEQGTSWTISNGGTPSFNTGPSDDLCGGGNYVYLETSCGANPNVGYLESPLYSAAGITTPTVGFWYHMFGADMGMLELQEQDGGGAWTTIWSVSGNQGDQWNFQEVGINTFDVGFGPEARFRFVGTRGAGFTSDMALDEICFGDPGPPPIHQANVNTASLQLDGLVCQDFSMGMCPFIAPLQVSYGNGDLMGWTVSSGPNGQQPYALFHTPGFGAQTMAPGFPTVAGIVDFSLPGFAVLELLIDGIAGTTTLDALLGDTTPSGSRTLMFTMPPGTGGSTLTTAQALVVDPTAAVGLQITAATQIDRTIAPGPIPPLPGSFVGTVPTGNGDDTSFQVVFSMGLVIPFYGANYSDAFVNSNGTITFGGGDTDFTPTLAELDGGQPCIAPYWTDLSPNIAGNNDFTETATSLTVSWVGVPEFGTTNLNDFGCTVDNLGVIQCAYAQLDAPTSGDLLVGISPGAFSPGGPSLPSVSQAISSASPLSLSGNAQESIAEFSTTGNPGYGIAPDPCVGLAVGTNLITFVPQPPTGIPGDAGYLAP